MRRYITETGKKEQGQYLQIVTVYPPEINQKQVKKEVGWSAIKGMIVNDKDSWKYKELKK